ncbi:MAG: RHS repeat-associated core domain-containing protein [bacterium]
MHENGFDAEGRLRQVRLPDGRTAELDYPPGAGTATLTVDGQVVTEIVDNAQGNTTVQRMAGGEEVRFAYDGQGRKSQVTFPDGTQERFTYDGNGRVLTQLDRAGGTTRNTYDAEGHLTARVDACGAETRFTYDALGRVTRVVDPLGRATQVEYDVAGNRSRLVQPDGAEYGWTYDAEGRPLEDRLPGGLFLRRTYDSQGRALTEQDSGGGLTRRGYDGDGLEVSTELPNGIVQSIQRDGEGRVIQDTWPAPMSLTRDSNGFVTSMTDALGHTTRYEHTLEGMVTRELYPDGTERRFEVDGDMRLTAGVDEAGGRTIFDRTYDGRVVATTLPDGSRWAFDYLGTGELRSVTDPDGRETRMTFDPCRRMTSMEYPDGATADYAYDAVGNLTRIDHPDGTFVERTYDAADRLIREARSDGTESRMTWTGFGRPETFTDARGVTGFTYDAGGRLTQMTQPDGARLRFGYDPAGRRTFAEARTPAGDLWRLDYLYDPVFGSLAAIVQGGQPLVTYGRDAAGQLTSIEYANGIRQLYMRDVRGRVTQLTTEDANGAIVADRRLTRDARGLITREVDEAGVERRYTYDPNERMVREERLEAGAHVLDRVYTYDARGNIASITEGGAQDVHRLDDRSRLLEAGGRVFDYNDRGELVRITEGGQQIDLTFDLEGRLREVDGPDGTRSYTYDHLGNRVADDVDGIHVGHLVAPRDQGPDATFRLPWTLVDYDAQGRLLRGYVAGPILHGVADAGGTRFAVTDPRGSVTGWADAQGAVDGRVDYDAWGQIIDGDLGPDERGFLGMPTDPTTGLVHLRARSYDPRAGRFISPDAVFGSPLDPRTFAPYTYSLNAPATYIDPTGEFVSLPSVMTAITVMSTLYSIGSIAWRLWHGEKVAWWEFVVAALSCVVPVMQGSKLAYIFFSRGALMRESGKYVWFHYTTAKTGEAILSSGKLIPGAAAGGKVWVTDIPPALMFNKWVGWYYQLTIGAWGGKLINFGKGAQATTQLEVAIEFTTGAARFKSAKMLNQFMAIGEEIFTDAKALILH